MMFCTYSGTNVPTITQFAIKISLGMHIMIVLQSIQANVEYCELICKIIVW